jgi:ZIP family zinc transporter
MKRAWLFVWAVALHNLPEGLAIGVAYGGIDVAKANSLATGISIQDVPEGLVVALALRTVGYGRVLSAGLGVLSGVIEPIAAVAGVALIGVSAGFLPFALAGAAGAMLFVIVNDVGPEMHQHGNGTVASVALVAGFVLMTVLDTALG